MSDPIRASAAADDAHRLGRGDQTRQKLIQAAIKVFGTQGFDGTTTRALARAAGVNLQAIPYYFGSKEKLYLAVAEHIAEAVGAHIDEVRQRAGQRLAQLTGGVAGGPVTLDAREARRLLAEILQTLGELFISDESEPWARFMIREQMEPTAAFQLVYGRVLKPLLETTRTLVGVILGEDPSSEHVRLRTLSLFGGVLVLRTANAAARAQLGWTTIGDHQVDAVRGLARELVDTLGRTGNDK